ncbi:MAG: hypothetical protein ACOC3G_02245 [Phycisphaeraceae bacterium]
MPESNAANDPAWRRGNTWRRGFAACGLPVMLVAVLLVPLLACTAMADQAGVDPAERARKSDASDAERLLRLVDQWLSEDGVPDDLDERIVVRDAIGVSVTLRVGGRTVGVGEAAIQSALVTRSHPEEAVELVELTRQASRRAFADLLSHLRRAAVRSREEGVTSERAEPPKISDAADRVRVDVQIARQLEPVQIPAEGGLPAMMTRFAPGYHGLVLVDGERAAMLWPGRAVALNLPPDRQIIRLVTELDRPVVDADRVGRPGGLALGRFEVIHVVRTEAGLPPQHMTRGHLPIPPRGVGVATVRDLSDRLGYHLSSRLTDEGFLGTYHPTTGKYDPRLAPAAEQALAAYTMLRYDSRRLLRDGPLLAVRTRVGQSVRLAQRIVTAEGENLQPATAALVLLCFDADPLSRHEPEQARQLAAGLLDVARAVAGGERPATEARRALLAAALASHFAELRDEAFAEAALDLVEGLWQDQQTPDVHTATWLGVAHTALAPLAEHERFGPRYRRWSQRQGDLIDLFLQQQVLVPPRIGPSDVIGGFDLQPTAPGSPPNPDWRSGPLLSLLAHGLRHEAVTRDRDRLGWLLSADLAARFTAQLMFTEAGCYYHAAPARSVGGIRTSLWDNRVSVGPHALNLLAIMDLLETIEVLEARRHGNDGE